MCFREFEKRKKAGSQNPDMTDIMDGINRKARDNARVPMQVCAQFGRCSNGEPVTQICSGMIRPMPGSQLAAIHGCEWMTTINKLMLRAKSMTRIQSFRSGRRWYTSGRVIRSWSVKSIVPANNTAKIWKYYPGPWRICAFFSRRRAHVCVHARAWWRKNASAYELQQGWDNGHFAYPLCG